MFVKTNPLYLAYDRENLTWAEMSRRTKLTVQHLIRIAQMEREEIAKRLYLSTYLKIRDILGIDLIN